MKLVATHELPSLATPWDGSPSTWRREQLRAHSRSVVLTAQISLGIEVEGLQVCWRDGSRTRRTGSGWC